MFNYEHTDYADMPLEQLGDMRDFALVRLETMSEALRDRVRAEHDAGVEISVIAKKARVSRQMVTAWVK